MRRASLVLALLGLLGVFVLPWLVPPTEPGAGPSYAFGFDNTVAIVALGACLAATLVLRAAAPHETGRALEWLRVPGAREDPAGRRAETAWAAGLSLLAAAAVLAWDARLVTPYWGEARYFLSRIDLVALGLRPYADFQFNYGPALLYVPVWLDRWTGGVLGLEHAYAVCVAACFPLGTALFLRFLRALALDPRQRIAALVLSSLVWFCVTLGLNYTPLRFALVPAVLVVLADASGGGARAGRAAFLASAGTLVGFLVSPEVGLTATACAGVFAVVSALGGGRVGVLAGGACVATGAAVLALLSAEGLGGLRAFASGSMSMPVYPSVTNLVYVGACLLVVPGLGAAAWRRRRDPRAPLAAALAAAGLASLPPALGRCDPLHVLVNGLVPITLLFPALAAHGARAFRALCGVHALAFGVLLHVSYWNGYGWLFAQALEEARAREERPEEVRRWREQWREARAASPHGDALNWRKVVPFPAGADELVALGRVGTPMGAELGVLRLLELQEDFVPSYHPYPIHELSTLAHVRRVVEESGRWDVLLLPRRARRLARRPPDERWARAILRDLGRLNVFPAFGRLEREPLRPEEDLAALLLDGREPRPFLDGQEYVLVEPPPSR